jgi:predicted phage replisome organizer
MADVKWIKITTDIFDDDKILLIESLPDADAIIVIWFKLLCLAGKQNNSGVFLLNDRIPYTDKMLATIFRRKESTVQLALNTFEQFGMIEVVDGVITIPNWGKHQNLDALEKKTAYMRDYMRNYREKQKLLASAGDGKPDCKTNSNSNVSRVDKNREEKEGEERENPPKSPRKGDMEPEAEPTVEIPFTGELLEEFNNWLAYKKEKRQPYKPRGLQSLVTQVKRYAEQFGDESTANAIRNSMASNYQGIVFDQIGKTAKPSGTEKKVRTFYDVAEKTKQEGLV